MSLLLYDDPKEFYQHALPLLLEHEVENNLMLGLAAPIVRNKHQCSEGDPLLGIALVGGEACAAVLMTPPHRLLLTRMAPEVAESVARQLADEGISLPGVMGPKEAAAHFIAAWAARTGQRAELAQALRIYRLDQVLPVPVVRGACVQASMDDYDLLLTWMPAFWAAVGERPGDVGKVVQRRLDDRAIYLWKTDAAVSMAGLTGPTPNGVRINSVYTSPEHRNRGYATANVAALSRRMLDAGKRFCFLYADLANSISNSMYQKIGYRPVCDVDAYRMA